MQNHYFKNNKPPNEPEEYDSEQKDKLGTGFQPIKTNKSFENQNENLYEEVLPWYKILSLPPKQMIIVDRMHSGARRHITLDFGTPIMLTDLVIFLI